MNNKARYYPKNKLNLKPDVEGVEMWAVSLAKTQFTYFEVEPYKTFDAHTHESEQITMVLEGELFFEFEDETFCVKKDEVIAIPSNILHSVCTKEKAVKAVDAWSPIMEKYK